MKKSVITLIVALILVVVFLTACPGYHEKADPIKLEDAQIPVKINDHEIFVGETTIQELLDDGFSLTVTKWEDGRITQEELDPEQEFLPDSDYGDISFWITDSAYARISVKTEEQSIKAGDAPISRLELHLSHMEEELPQDILLNGVSVADMSRTKAGEIFPDFEQEDLSIMQKGLDYECTFMFSPKTLMIYQFSLQQKEPEPGLTPGVNNAADL